MSKVFWDSCHVAKDITIEAEFISPMYNAVIFEVRMEPEEED